MIHKIYFRALLLWTSVLLLGAACDPTKIGLPSPTPSPSATPSATPTVTPTATPTATPIHSPTPTATPALTPTPTPPPTVSMTGPVSGISVNKTITVSAHATDQTALTKVEFYRDSSVLIGTILTPLGSKLFDANLSAASAGHFRHLNSIDCCGRKRKYIYLDASMGVGTMDFGGGIIRTKTLGRASQDFDALLIKVSP